MIAGCVARQTPAQRGADSGSPAVRATLTPIADLAVAARLDVVANGAEEIVVRYGDDLGPRAETRAFRVPKTGRLVATLIGLSPGAVSQAEVTLRSADGRTHAKARLAVTTSPMDPALPARMSRWEPAISRWAATIFPPISQAPFQEAGN